MKLSIVIPTVDGRERYLDSALEQFRRTTPEDTQYIIIRNRDTCGVAWNEGIREAEGEYILLSADDVEPAVHDWLNVGIRWVRRGYLPCARVLNSDGTLQSCGDLVEEVETGTICDFARIPFGSAEQVQAIYPIITTHYATDYWFSHRGRKMGWETLVVREFCFYHHFAQEGRVDDRLNRDMKVFWRKAKLPGEPLPG